MTQPVEQHFEEERQRTPNKGVEIDRAMSNYREAMLEMQGLSSTLSPDILAVQELTGNTIAMALNGKINIDPVAFKSKEELKYIFAHEVFHLEGLYSEGLIQQKLAELGIPGIRAKAKQDYRGEQSRVAEVTNRIGVQFTINYYKARKFSELLEVFKIACVNEGMTEDQARQMFFAAFTELESAKN